MPSGCPPCIPQISQILWETLIMASRRTKQNASVKEWEAGQITNNCTTLELHYPMLKEHLSDTLCQHLTSHPTSLTLYTNLPELLSWKQGPLVFKFCFMAMNAHGSITNSTKDFSQMWCELWPTVWSWLQETSTFYLKRHTEVGEKALKIEIKQ